MRGQSSRAKGSRRTETDHISGVDILIVFEFGRQLLLSIQTKLVDSKGNLGETSADRAIGTVDSGDEL